VASPKIEHKCDPVRPNVLIHLTGADGIGWQINQVEGFRGGLFNLRHWQLFGAQMGANYDQIYPTENRAHEAALGFLSANGLLC
jgi:hypothetical protein